MFGIDFRGEVAVVGLGRSGSAATRLLRQAGARVYASDGGRGLGLEATAAALRAFGVAVDVGSHDLDRIRRASAAVLSPGVPPDAPPVVVAREAGILVLAEAELGLRALGPEVRFAAVTGTNGKTTTTSLVAHLLTSAGLSAQAVGNIGTPVSEIALAAERPAVLAVELSSFQLHDMPTLRPTVGVLTNLAPDHLDRYPTIDAYYGDKMRLVANATQDSLWITNEDDPASAAWFGSPKGRRRRFSIRGRSDGWYDRERDCLKLGDVVIVERSRLPLLGDHNVANALAAALAAHGLGASVAAIGRGLETAPRLAHRIEPIREVGGVLWINDSKATNISSTEVAVAAMQRPFVLLLGGRHKGEPYDRLAPLLDRCRAVVAFGEARPVIVGDLGGLVRVEQATTFEEAMGIAGAQAAPGDVVLLSPACSSYDLFANYEQRGARFRALVEAM